MHVCGVGVFESALVNMTFVFEVYHTARLRRVWKTMYFLLAYGCGSKAGVFRLKVFICPTC